MITWVDEGARGLTKLEKEVNKQVAAYDASASSAPRS